VIKEAGAREARHGTTAGGGNGRAGAPPLPEGDPAGSAAPLAGALELERVLAHVAELAGHLRTLLALRAARRRLAVRRAVFLAVAVLLGAAALVPLIASGSTLLAEGLSQGLTELWGGSEWLGRLSAGAAILAGVAGLVAGAAGWISRRRLASLEARLGELAGGDDAA